MELLAMQMTGSNGVLSVPSEHLPGLIVLVAIMPTVWIAIWGCRALAGRQVSWAAALVRRFDGLSLTAKVALCASLVGALVHVAIVPTHWGDERTTALLFVADGIGFAVAFWWTFTARRHWRLVDVAMLGGTVGAYALYILMGWESADPVGLLTTTVELAAAFVVLSPAAAPVGSRGSHEWRIAAAALPVALLSLVGTTAIAGAAQAASTGGPTDTPSRTSMTGTSDTNGSPSTGSAATKKASPAMPGMTPGATTTDLSLPTTSPAGALVWPVDMGSMAPGMQMATPDCTAQPTAAQQQAAVTLVDQTVTAAIPYRSLAAAKAAGYVPVTPTGQRIVHYINPAIYRRGQTLDPSAIPVLVYANTTHGAVLSAAMYLMPRSADDVAPPQPGGCLTQWHIHTDLCFQAGAVVGTEQAGTTCANGSVNQVTQPMMHVWLTPVPGGPLAPDPSGASEIKAADAVPVLSTPNGTA